MHSANRAMWRGALKQCGWPVMCGIFAFAFDLISIGRPALWRDEAATIVVARRSPSAIVLMLRHDDAPLGAYYLFMHFWIKVTSSAVWLRLPSALAAAATVGLLFVLGKQLAGVGVGLAGALVLAALPFDTRFAQEARPYSPVMCSATIATLLLVRALRDRTPAAWRWYSVAVTATVLLHLLAATIIAAHLVTCLCANRRAMRRYRAWALAVIPGVVVGVVIGAFTAGESASHAWIPKAHLRTPYYAARNLASSQHALELLLAPIVIVALLAAVRRITHRGTHRATASTAEGAAAPSAECHVNAMTVAVPWLAVPGLILIAVSLWYPIYVSRYVLFSLPALAFVAGYGFVQLWQAVRLTRVHRALQIAVAACGAVALIAVVDHGQVDVRQVNSHGDNPSAEAAYLLSTARPGDGILYSPRDLVHSLLPFAPPGQLPIDALLKTSASASHTLNGVEVDANAGATSMVRFNRLWVLEVPGSGDTTPLADAETATLSAHYRVVSTKYLPGTVLVLYQQRTS